MSVSFRAHEEFVPPAVARIPRRSRPSTTSSSASAHCRSKARSGVSPGAAGCAQRVSAVSNSSGMNCDASAALLRPRLLPFVGQEMLQRREQKGAKPSARRIGPGHGVLRQQPREELLRQVLRLLARMTRAAARRRKAAASNGGTVARAPRAPASCRCVPPSAPPTNAS